MPSGSAISVSQHPELVLRLRLVQGKLVVLGPGKVELMKHIGATGSISEAARRMQMSYNRAWLHVKVLNSAFRAPLVLSLRGGKEGGGASLSETGRKVIEIFDRMEATAEKAAKDAGKEFRALFKK
jgi:molybdate transport system regulatory protein